MTLVSSEMLHWSHFIAMSLFGLGLLGFLIRKNALIVLMSIELMLNSVNLILVEFSMRLGSAEGIIFVIFIITIAAAEAAIGLGIILNLYRIKGSVEIDTFRSMQG